MPDARPGPAVVADAQACARAAADRHRLTIVELDEMDAYRTAATLLSRVWQAGPDQVITAELLRAFAYSGNYVAGAYRDGTLVGVAVGFFGADHLHSHLAGVAPDLQGAGIGYALKQHQRAWALDRGLAEVHWTFDPLVRRNAYFNLHKLGGLPTAYLPDFYGPMTDGINSGDQSDRLYLRWSLLSGRAVDAAHGRFTDVDAGALRAAGATLLLDRDPDAGQPSAADQPAAPAGRPPAPGRPALVAVPRDIEKLRPAEPALAKRWRYAVREALTGALGTGFRITGMSRDGYYVLDPPAP